MLGVAYAALIVLGLISGVTTFGGLLPLNEWDHGLHLVTSLLAFGAFFASRGTPDTARAYSSGRPNCRPLLTGSSA